MEQQVKQVPYGVADFATVIEQNLYYVDKTMFIPELEKQPRNLFFIRPRRFGKSIFLSMPILTMTVRRAISSRVFWKSVDRPASYSFAGKVSGAVPRFLPDYG